MTRTALVTGANRGIGLAIAEGLAARGLSVIVGARDLAAGERVAAGFGGRAVWLDLRDPASLDVAAKRIGPVDILVNNAGILGTGGVLDATDAFAESMDVMVRGPQRLMHHLVPGMVRRGYGRVVNVSSGWGAFSDGVAGPGAYGVAKAALNALTVSAARGMPAGVAINAMCPGWVRTRMGGMAAPRSPAKGAETAVWLATAPDVPSGQFFRDRARIPW